MGGGMPRKFRKARILSSNPCLGVNRAALLRPRAENFRRERRAGTRLRHSPEFSTAADATLADAQVFGYIAERTQGSGRHTKGDNVNRWGRQIRIEIVWLPK